MYTVGSTRFLDVTAGIFSSYWKYSEKYQCAQKYQRVNEKSSEIPRMYRVSRSCWKFWINLNKKLLLSFCIFLKPKKRWRLIISSRARLIFCSEACQLTKITYVLWCLYWLVRRHRTKMNLCIMTIYEENAPKSFCLHCSERKTQYTLSGDTLSFNLCGLCESWSRIF